jgi:asparagine synthase (glutamine-hydrolysing)
MCGIAGVLKFGRNGQVKDSVLRQMCAAMVHRGPDDEGIYVEGAIGLGMRRLSIIDLATGHQPIGNEDGTVWIVFNGEIYNHRALRDQLTALGHRFSTHSDTETIVHLYEEYGQQCVQHLRGMFAFAIWDSRVRKLFVARDRLGIKPLYYHLSPERFLFGSEIKVILAHPDIYASFHRAALPEYLAFGYVSGTETLYEGIHKLLPGHWLEVDEHGKVQIERYWDLDVNSDEKELGESDYVRTYRDLLESAVSSHMMSDVPLGVFLSGGLDSSAVAALATRIRGGLVETFSVGYSEHSYSELPHARLVAQHLNSIHHEVQLSRQDFFDALPQLIWHEDEPIAWPSSVALYFVARLARERVTVVLTGEGSDETLAGYSRYAFTLENAAFDRTYRRLLPYGLRRWVRDSLSNSSMIGAKSRRKLSHTFLAKDGASWPSFYFDNFFSAFSEVEQAGLLNKSVRAAFEDGQSYRHVLDYWEHSSGSMLQRLLYTDIKTYLVELLMKQDNMSMAASVESRVPFLDHELVEFAMRIPQRLLIKGLSGKVILKKAVADLLPASILHRPKLGFPTPWSGWLAGPQLNDIENLLLEPRSLDRDLFNPAAIQRLFREHRTGHRNHDDRIWRLLNMELWHRVCLEGDSRLNPSSILGRMSPATIQ